MKAAIVRSIAGVAATLLLAAAQPAAAANYGVGVHAGTLGLGADFGYGFTDSLVGRVGFNTLTLDEDFTEDGIEYSADLELQSFHALIDWHVLGGGFRLTGGLVANGNAFEGGARIEPGDQVGNSTAVSSGRLDLDVEYDEVAPYLGVGWGNIVRGWSKVAFSVDVGLMAQGAPDVDIDDNGTTGVSESDLRQEEREVEDELENFELYPVLNAAIVFRF